MSILIRGMEMPREPTLYVFMLHPDGKIDGLPCKAVPVPPHGDLISREWLVVIGLHLMNIAKNDDIANGVKWLWQYVIEAPTIIEAEEEE